MSKSLSQGSLKNKDDKSSKEKGMPKILFWHKVSYKNKCQHYFTRDEKNYWELAQEAMSKNDVTSFKKPGSTMKVVVKNFTFFGNFKGVTREQVGTKTKTKTCYYDPESGTFGW